MSLHFLNLYKIYPYINYRIENRRNFVAPSPPNLKISLSDLQSLGYNFAPILLVMTKKDMLDLLGTVNSIQAGAAISYVLSLKDNDPRFKMSFGGNANAAIGFWQREELGEFFQ